MRKWLLYIICIGVLVASCSNLDEGIPGTPADTDKVNVTFTLAIGNQTGYTPRTVAREITQQQGDDYENLIMNINNGGFQVVAYSLENDRYLGEVSNLKIIRNWDTESGHVYEFIGELKDVVEMSLNCKFMVFANCSGQVSVDTNLSQFTYEYLPDNFKNQKQGIPMWGVKKITTTLIPGKRTDLGTIYLLRAMAKVEVKMADEAYTFTKVHINSYYKEGYCLPEYYSRIEDSEYYKVNGESAYNPYSQGQTIISGTDFFKTADNTYILYIPEYNRDDQQQLLINVGISKEGKPVELENPIIYFKDYNTDTEFNVIRNHYYSFNVSVREDLSGNIKTDIQSSIDPWTTVEVSSDYE